MVEYAHNGDVTIAYEVFGDPQDGEPLLLIMGLDFQMPWWPDGFIEELVRRGFAVARFDNRDTGLSTHFDSARKENPFKALLGKTAPVYAGLDMLDDALAVMDALGWESANIMGGSMGAGLAQALTLTHPDRVRSLTSAMGLPVDAGTLKTFTYIKYGIFGKLMRISGGGPEALVDIYRAISSPGYPFPEQWARQTAELSEARAPRDPKTTQRQLAAGRAQKYPSLSQITVPTLVISGQDDPLIKTSGGRDTAARISGSTFITYAGMGHNIPQELWRDVADRVAQVAGI